MNPTEIRALVQAAREQWVGVYLPRLLHQVKVTQSSFVDDTRNRDWVAAAHHREPQLLEIIEGLLAELEDL